MSASPQYLSFANVYNGLLYSLMSWQQLTRFWEKSIDAGAGWYLYAIGEARPEKPANAHQVKQFIREIDMLLHHEHCEDYCGIVYADDIEAPTLVKIYDPNHLGSSCGSGKTPPPLPGWLMSRMPPDEMTPRRIIPANRKRWWRSFFTG
ncbi:MAG TPA: hypothetical protein DEP05_05660 [Betaproteobacteria bacterium]|nr:hypothetical protein [Betaproteobacteria bacterium]